MDKTISLRKERLLVEGQRKGISDKFIANFKVNIASAETLSIRELKVQVIQSLARQLRRKFREMHSYDELKKLVVETISFGSTKMNVESLGEMADKNKKREIIKLLAHCTKFHSNEGDYSFENYNHHLPLSVNVIYYNVLTDRTDDVEAYSFPKEALPKRFRTGSWRLGRGNNYAMKDFGELCAEVFLVNIMEEFIVKNKEIYHYIVTKDYVSARLKNKEITVPTDRYGEIISEYIREFKLLPDGFRIVKSEEENNKLHHFDLDDFIVDAKMVTFDREHIDKMLLEFLESTNSIVVKVDQEIRISDYARAFETKKNINPSTMEAMKDNHFLSRYGYVEIDNDVCVEKFQKLSDEFRRLKKEIYIPKADDHSFRIKKLGKHRSAGIYFSGAKATIVDIDTPDSYIHELAHQIDFTLGKGSLISETISFRHIIDEYKALVREAVSNLDINDPFVKKWKGNSSFNSEYYFQPTEIFARSFELYIESKGIKTSLLKDTLTTPVYPKRENFISLIEKYFDNLFSFFEPVVERENEKVHAVSSSIDSFSKETTIEHFSGSEQLVLF